ncbi:hypothetical protein C4D60_Mb07t22670 [Musa balbisiana]|uniref:Uncharacterized protein n=1 Tax=Musa balbisiana TaxID=52838 RepID=A0A4S8JHI0_MUSBA|nr:hypothetical protein C4D60_Mb07t22670 [Musa balbisiana]
MFPFKLALAEFSSNRGLEPRQPTHHYKTPYYALSNRIETLSTSAGRAFLHGRRETSCDLLSLCHRNERVAIGLSLLVDQSSSTFFVAVSKISGVDGRCRSPRKIGWMQL